MSCNFPRYPCPVILLSCHHNAGAVADMAGERKSVPKYFSLGPGYSFTCMTTETLGAIGKRSLAFLKELGHRVRQYTSKVVRAYLFQYLSELCREEIQLLHSGLDFVLYVIVCVHVCIHAYLGCFVTNLLLS